MEEICIYLITSWKIMILGFEDKAWVYLHQREHPVLPSGPL